MGRVIVGRVIVGRVNGYRRKGIKNESGKSTNTIKRNIVTDTQLVMQKDRNGHGKMIKKDKIESESE